MKSAFTLRLPEELRKKVEREAKNNKVSINHYICFTLTRELSYKEAERWLKTRIKYASSREEMLQLLDSIVPNIAPLPEDKL